MSVDEFADLPWEEKLPAHRRTVHDGGASKEKAPSHSHWRHRWQQDQHHDTKDLMICPPPPEEALRSSEKQDRSHARRTASGAMAQAASGVMKAATGLLGFAHNRRSAPASVNDGHTASKDNEDSFVETPKNSLKSNEGWPTASHSKDGKTHSKESAASQREKSIPTFGTLQANG